MVTNGAATREVGRPRTFSDEDAFRATTVVLARLGHHRLSLAAVAAELGCTRQALIRRFGAKRALLHAYMGWEIERAEASYNVVRDAHASPLAALRARFLSPNDPFEEPEDPLGRANLLAFLIGAGTDPALHGQIERLFQIYETGVAGLIADAVHAGELLPCDSVLVARLLNAATIGELLQWAVKPRGEATDRVAVLFDAILAPLQPQSPLGRNHDGAAS